MKLSDFELLVMQIMWKLKRTSAPQVHKEVIKEKNVTYATVKTIINRLEKKGAIERCALEGRTIYYSSVVSQEEIKTPLFKSLIKSIFGSEKRPLFNHIVKDESITAEDIEYLEKILAEKKRDLKK